MALTEERKKYLAKWRAENRDKTRESNRKWRESKPSYFKEYYAANKAACDERTKKWCEENSESVRVYHRSYYHENKPKLKEQAVARGEPAAARIRANKWRQENPERKTELARKYWDQNRDRERARLKAIDTPEFRRENLARYRARKNNAMPQWLTSKDKAKIRSIYTEATKGGLEVDHIVPLRGKKVCGLHVPWNLQLLPPIENKMKSNRLPPDHECIATVSVSA